MSADFKLAICLTVACSFLLCGCQQKVAVPKKFKKWNSADGAFAIEYPMLWLPQGGVNKNHGSSFAKFERGSISIRVDSSYTQALLGNMLAGGGIDQGDLPDEMQAEALLHEQNLEYYTENYRDYEEMPAETRNLPIGRTRVAEFTATEGFGKLHGIRATTISGDKDVTFRAYCPEELWEEFGPFFYRMLDSLTRGVKKN